MKLTDILAACIKALLPSRPTPEETKAPEKIVSPVEEVKKSGTPSQKESKEITSAHSLLQECWPKIKEKFEAKYPGYTLKIAFVWRSPSFQQELYQIGRRDVPGEKVVTNCDGVKKLSNHNYWPARAIDVNIYKDGKVQWADSEYSKLTPIIQELGLIHGLTWKSFPDAQHIELPKNIA